MFPVKTVIIFAFDREIITPQSVSFEVGLTPPSSNHEFILQALHMAEFGTSLFGNYLSSSAVTLLLFESLCGEHLLTNEEIGTWR